ncbi:MULTISPECIES: chemotaxis protein CheW [Hydrogenophaga]|jgi:twitching motility protein PilI|uniref:Twitching motility protein, chemotaxis protein cheW n=1 Tax=Hydrogenophaga intermedia TaxID=65786 RepID=A0A1L1PQX5_HYDIT|nr:MULTISPECIES: chemotaxis protein CheW [Hydrogenophaga]AOS80381.1 chemotaxis protein CheW [Hydrogenophaga sp. PBC]TMU78036.1 chemotaxis protein CheW [Hydrogenophaga intermedia]CDN88466.1 Twitching motility protein, chemotaxis protein cheW [Hydrogenophaga intermedia]
MAKRQSLKELQERLAQRLTAAKSEALTATWLAIEAGGRRYLLPLVQSGEIFPWSTVQAVPYTKSWYVGVANLRGGLHGVIDLADLVQGSARGSMRPAERITSESRLVSLHGALGLNAVLWIDRLLGLRNPGAFSAMGERPAEAPGYVTRVLVDAQGQDWQELDLQLLVSEPEFLAVAA